MAAMMIIVALILVATAALYFIQKRNFQYWAKKGVVSDEPHIIYGNLERLMKLKQTIFQFMDEQYKKHADQPVIGFYGFSKPYLIIRDVDLVKDITIKDFSNFSNRSFNLDDGVDPLGAKTMFSSRGDRWRSLRLKAATSFSNAKLRAMFNRLQEVSQDIKEVLSKECKGEGKETEVRGYSMRYAVDVITSCAFGSEGLCVKEPETSAMYRVYNKILVFGFKQSVAANFLFFARPVYILLGKILGFKFYPKTVEDHMQKVVTKAYHDRVKNKHRSDDIFDLITWSQEPAYQGLENKAAAAFQMLFAGSETTATTITFALYELARQPHYQDRLRAEINETLAKNNGVSNYDLVTKMELLDLVVKETMRLWPILPFLDRTCEKEYTLAGTNITLDKGTHVFIPMYSIQRDPTFYPEPDKFIPERFKKENMVGVPELAYIPFGAGPRYCIGKRFGTMSIKNFLTHFLPNYEVSLTEQSSKPIEWKNSSFTLFLKNGMKLKLTPLKKELTTASS